MYWYWYYFFVYIMSNAMQYFLTVMLKPLVLVTFDIRTCRSRRRRRCIPPPPPPPYTRPPRWERRRVTAVVHPPLSLTTVSPGKKEVTIKIGGGEKEEGRSSLMPISIVGCPQGGQGGREGERRKMFCLARNWQGGKEGKKRNKLG